jgi:hypothetical protein
VHFLSLWRVVGNPRLWAALEQFRLLGSIELTLDTRIDRDPSV